MKRIKQIIDSLDKEIANGLYYGGLPFSVRKDVERVIFYVLQYIEEGHTVAEAREYFGVNPK